MRSYRSLCLPSIVAALVAGVLAGCAMDAGDGEEEVSTTVGAITIPVGSQGCGSLYRKSASSQNVYMWGCGGSWFGQEYRVPFNGFNVYYCFTDVHSVFIGHQGDLAGSRGIPMDNPVEPHWCRDAFPSNHSSGG